MFQMFIMFITFKFLRKFILFMLFILFVLFNILSPNHPTSGRRQGNNARSLTRMRCEHIINDIRVQGGVRESGGGGTPH